MLVGTQSDLAKPTASLIASNPIPQWQKNWTLLPLHPELFITSRNNSATIDHLLDVVKQESQQIMSRFSKQVPIRYMLLLKTLQQRVQSKRRPFISINEISQSDPEQHLMPGLRYLHAVGDIVMLPDGLVCTDPAQVSHMMSSIICPESVQLTLPHIANGKMEILTSEQIGRVLTMKEEDEKYENCRD